MERRATLGGLAALALWSASVALTRGLCESLGTLTGPGLAALLGGALGLLWTDPRRMLALPKRYLLVCGGLFVSCNAGMYLAVGGAPNRSAVLAVALVNYLWPALTVALSVPVLGRRARWYLPLGCLIAVAGTAMALLGGQGFRCSELGTGVLVPAAWAGVAALSWGLYSNLARLWGGTEEGAVPLFALCTGAALLLLRVFRPEPLHWTPKALMELVLLGVASMMAAYALWDEGMRKGDALLLGLASYFVPIASTLISSVYLGVWPGWGVLAGSGLVVAGAFVSRRALVADAKT
ncbi:MAG: EamA family transporter [Elusimicrobiota bacterium]